MAGFNDAKRGGDFTTLSGVREHLAIYRRSGSITVLEAPPSATMVLCAMPTLHRLVIHPEGDGAALNRCSVMFRPIDDFAFALAHELPPTVVTGDQIAAFQKGSIYLGNNAVNLNTIAMSVFR